MLTETKFTCKINFLSGKFAETKISSTFAHANENNAEVAQLVEHNLAKVRVAGSSPVFRSSLREVMLEWWNR